MLRRLFPSVVGLLLSMLAVPASLSAIGKTILDLRKDKQRKPISHLVALACFLLAFTSSASHCLRKARNWSFESGPI